MPTLNIGGKKVKVDDSFLKLSPEQQNATVDEIAHKISAAPAAPQQASPPPGLVPGSREYADWAAQAARAGQKLPQVSGPAPTGEPPAEAPNLTNSTIATVNGLVNGVPVLGPLAQGATDMIGGGIAQITGGNFNDYVKHQQEVRAQAAKSAPIASVMGNLGGSMAAMGGLGALPGGAEALGLNGGALLPRMVNSGLSSQGLYTADQLVRGKRGTDTLGYGVPALVGAASPAIGDLVKKGGSMLSDAVTNASQRSLSKAATVGAPSADELKAASRAMFDAVDNSGVTVSTNKFSDLVSKLAGQAKADHIDETLDPKAFGVYRQLIGILGDAQSGARPLTISDLHTIRQIAQSAAVSTEGRDAMFSNRIVSELDKFIGQPGALSAGGQEAGNNLLQAISTWGRARRTSLIEKALYKAQNQASGLENGLRTQFRQLLQNPKTRSLFNAAEQQAMEDVARGTSMANIVKLLGKFGFGPNNMLGGSIGATLGGALGGIPGAIGTAAVGAGARKISETMTKNAADLAAKVVATPNVPIATQFPNLLAPMAKPLEITIRGAGLMPGR